MAHLEEMDGTRHPLPGLTRTVDMIMSVVRSSRETPDTSAAAAKEAEAAKRGVDMRELQSLFERDLTGRKHGPKPQPLTKPTEAQDRADLDRIRRALYSKDG